jgi:hypothetical protein
MTIWDLLYSEAVQPRRTTSGILSVRANQEDEEISLFSWVFCFPEIRFPVKSDADGQRLPETCVRPPRLERAE